MTYFGPILMFYFRKNFFDDFSTLPRHVPHRQSGPPAGSDLKDPHPNFLDRFRIFGDRYDLALYIVGEPPRAIWPTRKIQGGDRV